MNPLNPSPMDNCLKNYESIKSISYSRHTYFLFEGNIVNVIKVIFISIISF